MRSPPTSTGIEVIVRTPARRSELIHIIWILAWPVILTFSLESLVGLIDTLLVGRLGAAAVAAVGVGVQFLFGVNAVMCAVGTGTLAIVARQVGADEIGAAEDTILQSVLAVAVLATTAVVPIVAWAPQIVTAVGVDPEVVVVAALYGRRVMVAVPADAVLFVIFEGLRGAGDMRKPLAVGVVVHTLKVLGNYVLLFGKLGFPALGVVGSALGTAIAFIAGAALAALLLARGHLILRLPRARLRPRLAVMRRVLSVGYPAAGEQALMQIGFFLYLMFAARYGTSAVAAYFIGVRILALSFLPGSGFAAAAATLVGQNLGAGTATDAERAGWESSRLAIFLMTAGGVFIFAAAWPIARLFVDDAEVVAATVSFIQVLAVAQPLMAIDFTLGGALRGAGDTRFPLLVVALGFYGCRLGFAAAVTLWLHLSLFWLWFALLGDYLARSALKGYRFRSGCWKTRAI